MRAARPAVETAVSKLLPEQLLFEWLVKTADLEREEVRASSLRRIAAASKRPQPLTPRPNFTVYLRGAKPLYPEKYLPLRADGNLEGFLDRITRLVGGDEFGFQVPLLQAVDWPAFWRLSQAITPVLEAVGLRVSRFNCFLGNYRRTPDGVHIDPHHLHAFQYVVHGERVLRAWDPAPVVKKYGPSRVAGWLQHPLESHRELTRARPLRARPGQLIYWPGSYAHCIDARGPSAGVGIIFESNRPQWSSTLKKHAGETIRSYATSIAAKESPGGGPFVVNGSRSVGRHLRAIAEKINTPKAEVELLLAHACELSGGFLTAVPALLGEVRLDSRMQLKTQLTPIFRILHAVHRSTLIIAVHGHGATWSAPASIPTIRNLLRFLNARKVVNVGATVARYVKDGTCTEGDVMALLAFFVRAGALTIESP